jgi:hypothetical protein
MTSHLAALTNLAKATAISLAMTLAACNPAMAGAVSPTVTKFSTDVMTGAPLATPTLAPSQETETHTVTITPTKTITPTFIPTDTPTVTLTPTQPSQPGLMIRGHVHLEDGSGLPNVNIYRGFAVYPGELAATTDANGYYESSFQFIPGDEIVRVWAELEGYQFELEDSTWTWEQGHYAWRHYHGYEERTLNFLARPVS